MEEDKVKPIPSEVHNTVLETYAGDIAEVIENDTEGLVKKIIHGEEEHEKEKMNLSPESKKNKFFMIISILFLVLGISVLLFFVSRKDDNVVPVEKQFTPIIFNDQSTFLEISGFKKDEIIQTVMKEINSTKVKVGGVEGVYLTENKQIVGLREFISLIKGHLVPGDNTTFVSDNFMFGAMLTGLKSTSPEAGDFFMLLKVRSTADIFDAMRAWESNLLTDLAPFLGINLSSDTNYLFKKDFTDGIIENKNARILYDSNNDPILMYIFADDNSVVVTSSPVVAHEIMLRLASSQKKQ